MMEINNMHKIVVLPFDLTSVARLIPVFEERVDPLDDTGSTGRSLCRAVGASLTAVNTNPSCVEDVEKART